MIEPNSNMTLFSDAFYSATSPYGEATQPIVISQPVSDDTSFEWSDFPALRSHDVTIEFPSSDDSDFRDTPFKLQLQEDCTLETSSLSSESDYSASTTHSNVSNSGTRVSFSDTVRIRTHSVVLGDHPYCPILALELGWEYNDGEARIAKHKPTKRRKTIHKRSYLERKRLLQRMSGIRDYHSLPDSLWVRPDTVGNPAA